MILFLGAYDGFFGPGTGTFLIFGFLYFGYNFVTAAGNAKAMNLASNLGGIAAFLFLGKVYFIYAIPMALCEIIGAIWGKDCHQPRCWFYQDPLPYRNGPPHWQTVYEVFLR